MSDGSKITFNRGEITEESGATTKMTEYDVLGLKYVPVKVKTSDLDALKVSYRVIENGSELAGGYSEKNLVSYTGLVANVTPNTNGLKTATKNEDGIFQFLCKSESWIRVRNQRSGTQDSTNSRGSRADSKRSKKLLWRILRS